MHDGQGRDAGDCAALEQLVRRQELILQAAGEGILSIDPAGCITFANPAAARMAGYAPEELLGRSIHATLHYALVDGSPYPAERCPILAVFQDGAVHRVSGEVFWRRDGTSFPVEFVSTPIRDAGGVAGAVVLFRDIGERRAAEERQATLLRQAEAAEARFRGLLESAPDAIVITDGAGCIVLINRQAELAFGYAREDLLGQAVEVLMPARFRGAHVAHRGRYYGQAHPRPMGAGLDLFGCRRDGSEFPTEISLSPVEVAGETLVISVIRDISERKRGEEALRQSEERFRLLVQGVEDYAIFLLTPDGRVASWNAGAQRLKGYAAQEIIGRDYAVFFPSEDVARGEPARELAAATEHGRWAAEGWRVRKDGSRFLAGAVLTALRDGAGGLRGFAKVTRDITAQRELERHKDEFLANVSHDLRTPLAAIKASIGVVLANEPPGTPPPLHRLFGNIDQAADRMARLVDDLLELARLQAGRVRLRPQRRDLRELVRRCLAAVEPLAERRGQRVQARLPAAPAFLAVDEERLERALLNLLDNARRYGREGGLIRCTLERRGEEWLLAVADDGPGILPAEQGHIFERFYRPQGASRNEGSGLGLPIARAMVELHGGRLWLESVPGRGSTFHIALPADPVPAALSDAAGRRPVGGEA